MARYWPNSFFAALWIETEPRSINAHKKHEANTRPSWLNQLGQYGPDSIIMLSEIFFYGAAGRPKQAR